MEALMDGSRANHALWKLLEQMSRAYLGIISLEGACKAARWRTLST